MCKEWLLPVIFIAGLASYPVWSQDCPVWSPTQARAEMIALHDRLDGWNQAYRTGGQSPVDDAVYDQASKRFLRWRNCFPEQAPPLLAHLADATGNVRSPVAQTGLAKLPDGTALAAWMQVRGNKDLLGAAQGRWRCCHASVYRRPIE